MTNKLLISHSKNVTNLYVFTKDLEMFKVNNESFTLSKGVLEKSNPLPVVSSISKSFFKYFNDESQVSKFIPSNNPDQEIIKRIFKDAYDTLQLKQMPYNPLPLDLKDAYNPLTIELLALIYAATAYVTGKRVLNRRFSSLLFSLGISPIEIERIQDMRLEEQEFFRAKIVEWEYSPYAIGNKFNGELEDALQKELGLQRTLVTNPNNLLGLAWSELFFAELYMIPASICTFCGSSYRLVGKKNKGSFRKNNCGEEKCKKLARLQRDLVRRQLHTEDVRTADKIRKRSSRKSRAINLIKQNKTNEVIAKATGASVADIEVWREQYKKKRL